MTVALSVLIRVYSWLIYLSFLKDKKPLIIGIIEIPMLQEIIGV